MILELSPTLSSSWNLLSSDLEYLCRILLVLTIGFYWIELLWNTFCEIHNLINSIELCEISWKSQNSWNMLELWNSIVPWSSPWLDFFMCSWIHILSKKTYRWRRIAGNHVGFWGCIYFQVPWVPPLHLQTDSPCHPRILMAEPQCLCMIFMLVVSITRDSVACLKSYTMAANRFKPLNIGNSWQNSQKVAM